MSFFNSKQDKVGILICLASAVIFGFYPPTAKAAYNDGANIIFVILLAGFCRFFFLFAGSLVQKNIPFKGAGDKKLIVLAGFLQALTAIGITGAVYYIPGSLAIVIMFMYSILLLFYSAWKGQIALNKINVTFTILALVGLMIGLNIFDAGQQYPMIGYVLAIIGCLSTFGRTYIYQGQTSTRSPITVGAESFSVAMICLLPILLFQDAIFPQTSYGFVMATLSGLTAAVGSFGMFYGIKLLGAYKFSMIMKLEPIFTALFGAWLVSEILQPSQYMGIIIVVASLVAIQLFDKQAKAK